MRRKLKIQKLDLLSIIVSFLIIVNLRILDFGDWQAAYRMMTAVVSFILGIYCIFNIRIYYEIN